MLLYKAKGSILLGFPNISGYFSGIGTSRQLCSLHLKVEGFYMLHQYEASIVSSQAWASPFFLTRTASML